jgi:YegS/Rv2252/BmrU family lipid kinase
MQKYKLIVNPTSGRGYGEEAITEIEKELSTLGLEYVSVKTEGPWHAAELAEQAVIEGFDVVVSVGGDGTANEVINGLMSAKNKSGRTAAMGVICVGRGNDFAFGIGIPTDLIADCRILAEDHRMMIDVGLVKGGLFPEGRYFGNGVGIGFDAVVGFEALKLKRLSGFPSYIVAALKTIFLYYQPAKVMMEFNDKVVTQPSLMVSVMNGRRMGGGFMMAPEGIPNDGLFDLCLVRGVSRARIFTLIPLFMAGKQAGQAPVSTGRTSRIIATALDGSLPAHADGETLCTDGTKLEMEILPNQIEIVCQRIG